MAVYKAYLGWTSMKSTTFELSQNAATGNHEAEESEDLVFVDFLDFPKSQT